MAPQPFRVVRRHSECPGTFSLTLAPSDRLPPADQMDSRLGLPGQFNMLYVFGVGEVPISIASVPGQPLLHTVRATGSVTEQMGKLRRGDGLGVRGPFGSHWPLAEAEGKALAIFGQAGTRFPCTIRALASNLQNCLLAVSAPHQLNTAFSGQSAAMLSAAALV